MTEEIRNDFSYEEAMDKLYTCGPDAVRDRDLVGLYLGSSSWHKREAAHKRIVDANLLHAAPKDLSGAMSRPKAIGLVAAVELSRRALNQGMGIAPSITKPADAVVLVADYKNRRREHFVALFLNARNQVIEREEVSVGSLNASLVHPREVFFPAVGTCAASVILVHNHPSGDVTPSREDIELTRRMVRAGEILGIEVLDHIVLGADRFLSMKEADLF